MKGIIFLLLAFVLSGHLVYGQTIKGNVYSAGSVPLTGATVRITGTTYGTFTDAKGFFEFPEIPAGKYTLEISYVGYKKQNAAVNSPFTLNPLIIILADDIITTGQVVVTASKHEEKLSELPVSAIVLLPSALESRNRITLDEALRYVPGVNMSLDQISIRGSSGYTKGAGTRVLTAIDGVPIYSGDTGEIIWEMIPISNIDRVEIIKGPASSLYGSTAIGGVINVLTKSIYEKPITQVSTYAGFYSSPYYSQWKWNPEIRTFYGFGINHSNSIGRFAYSLTLKKIENDGYRQNDYSKRLLGFTKIDFRPDSLNSFSFFMNYLNMNRGNFLYWKDGANAFVPKDEDNGKIVKSDRWFTSLIYKHDFSDNFSAEIKASLYNSFFEGIGIEVNASRSNLIRNEILTHLNLSNKITLTSGLEFSNSTINSDIFQSKEFSTFSVYSQAEYKGIKDLTATLGLRYDFIKLDSLSGSEAVTPKLGLNYKINDRVILRGSLGTGFRAPTPAEVFTSIGVGNIPIKVNPGLTFEKSISIDAGMLFTPIPEANYDISFFYNEYVNFIEPVLINSGYIQFTNLPKAKTAGFEVVNDTYLFKGLVKTRLGYTYLWSRDVENNSPMKYRPLHTVIASINILPHPFEFTADFRFMTKPERVDENLANPPISLVPDGGKRVDVYVTDLSAGYNFSLGKVPVKFYLYCKNLFNYTYVEFIGNVAPIRSFSASLDFYF